MNVTFANLAVEFFIAEHRTARLVQLGDQVSVGGIRRGIRQGHARQRVEITQAGAGQFEAQVQGAKVDRVGQGARQLDTGITDFRLCLQGKRPVRILQCQQSADFALAREFLAVILAFDLQAKRIVHGGCTLVRGFFRGVVADDVAERNRLAQRVDQQVELRLQVLIVKGDMALVEAYRTDVHNPRRRFGVRVFGVELEHPVGTPISQALQLGIGFSEIDARDDHTLPQ
ncbi:hypothetical protein D3C87_1314400 [compost metagenome]